MPPMGPPGRRNDFKKPKNAKKTFTRILKYMGKNKLFLILVFLMLFLRMNPSAFLARNLYHRICFDHIVFLQIVELLKYKTALVTCVDFLHVVLETL